MANRGLSNLCSAWIDYTWFFQNQIQGDKSECLRSRDCFKFTSRLFSRLILIYRSLLTRLLEGQRASTVINDSRSEDNESNKGEEKQRGEYE